MLTEGSLRRFQGIWVGTLALAFFAAVLVWIWPLLPQRPNLIAQPAPGGVRVAALLLGEYTYPVEQLEVTAEGSAVPVLRLEPGERETFQFHSAVLVPGRNAAQLSSFGSGRIAIPSGETFILEPGGRYAVSIRVRSAFPWARTARATFTVPERASGTATADVELHASVAPGEGPGELEIRLSVGSSREVALYSWRGAIDPMLHKGLTISLDSEDGRRYRVERARLALPKFPHEDDVANVRSYDYPEPLRVRVLDESGHPASGCFAVVVVYDSTGADFDRIGLTPLRLTSEPRRTCIE